MRTRFPQFVTMVALIGLAACGTEGGGGDDGTGRGEVAEADANPEFDAHDDDGLLDGDAVDDTGDVTADGLVDFNRCTFRGRVLDEAGAPIEKVSIVVCGEDASKCVKGTSKADGTWTVAGAARTALGAKVLGGPSGHTSVSLPLAPCATPTIDVDDVVLFVPAPGDGYDGVSDAWLQVHPDLALQVPPGAETQMYETEFQAQAAAVAPDKLHPLLAEQVEPVAVFALVPYYAEATGPIPFEATLPVASTTVGVYVLDYLTGEFLFVEDVAVDADGVARASEGGGLPQFTWVAFVER
jgi:hypothetical protein